MIFTTRFAPSPTGPLHLGHAYSAIVAHDMARAAKGRFLLRIDDLDQSRARAHWAAQIEDDLQWLGLGWDGPVRRQSGHFADYGTALARLADTGLLYPCSCKRRDIQTAIAAPQEGVPTHGPDGLIYPGTCRGRPISSRQPGDALRLDLARAFPGPLPGFDETGPEHAGTHPVTLAQLREQVSDQVLARPGMPASYHFAVVLDDAATDVTHVIRGADLFEATPLQVALHHLLDLNIPTYHHHRLIRDEAGKRLAKRDDARAIATYRAAGKSPDDIRAMVGITNRPAASSG